MQGMEASSLVTSDLVSVELGAGEPLDVHNAATLCWWLQCHGIKPVSLWRKQQLI